MGRGGLSVAGITPLPACASRGEGEIGGPAAGQNLAERLTARWCRSRGHETLIVSGAPLDEGKKSEPPHVDSYEVDLDGAKRFGVRQFCGAVWRVGSPKAAEAPPQAKTWRNDQRPGGGGVEVTRI